MSKLGCPLDAQVGHLGQLGVAQCCAVLGLDFDGHGPILGDALTRRPARAAGDQLRTARGPSRIRSSPIRPRRLSTLNSRGDGWSSSHVEEDRGLPRVLDEDRLEPVDQLVGKDAEGQVEPELAVPSARRARGAGSPCTPASAGRHGGRPGPSPRPRRRRRAGRRTRPSPWGRRTPRWRPGGPRGRRWPSARPSWCSGAAAR